MYTYGLRFPKITRTFLGSPVIETLILGHLYWGPLIYGNYHIHERLVKQCCVGTRTARVLLCPGKFQPKTHETCKQSLAALSTAVKVTCIARSFGEVAKKASRM